MTISKFTKAKRRLSLVFLKYFPKILSILLILLGFGIIIFASVGNISSSSRNNDLVVSENNVSPVKIYIPKLSKTLNVSAGFVTDNRWTVSNSGVSHLTSSVVPGSRGNAVLYGHNRDELLGSLWKVQNGDLVYVILSDGSITKYEIFERREVKPNQVEILDDVGDSRLTVYTCSGFLDSARYVVVGQLI